MKQEHQGICFIHGFMGIICVIKNLKHDEISVLINESEMLKVAVVYHYIAHYREPIFKLLCEQDGDVEYTLVSGVSAPAPALNTINVEKAKLSITNGGLRWRLINNIWIGKSFLWQSGIVKLALTREFDVIVYLGDAYHISTWVSCFLARLRGKRTYMWSHGFLKNESGIKGNIREFFYRLSDGMLLYHHRAREILIARGFCPGKLDVIYNSLDVEKQKKVRRTITNEIRDNIKIKLFNTESIYVLLWIGRLTAHKKLNMIVDVVEKLKEQGVNIGFVLVGDGPEKEALENDVRNRSLQDQVKFYGSSHDESELGPIISMSDLCVAPGEVGLTCMHSLVYGTPVVTHDNPDYQMPEYEAIQEGVSGSFFKYNNTNDLVASVHKWINNDVSRNQIRKQCYDVIDKFYNPKVQLKIIDNLVKGNPSTLSEHKIQS